MKVAPISIKVKIFGQHEIRRVKLSHGTKITDLLDQFGQNRETVVVRLNGKIVAEEERLADGDSVEILTVVTGG